MGGTTIVMLRHKSTKPASYHSWRWQFGRRRSWVKWVKNDVEIAGCIADTLPLEVTKICLLFLATVIEILPVVWVVWKVKGTKKFQTSCAISSNKYIFVGKVGLIFNVRKQNNCWRSRKKEKANSGAFSFVFSSFLCLKREERAGLCPSQKALFVRL